MHYMVIETFKDARAVYQRLRDRGRLLPEGLRYVDSWMSEDLRRCFQLMQTDDPMLFAQWTANWSDLMEFEIVPVVGSAAAREAALR